MYFTYLFKWTSHHKKYYGVRYKDGALPESLCTTYFSSSKYVKSFIAENGLPDVVQVRRVFKDKISAKRWEEKVLRRLNAIKNNSWLNRCNNNAFKDIICDERIKLSISNSRKGQSFGKMYNNGTINKFFKTDDIIPLGWIKGRISSLKQQDHYKRLNSDILTKEKRKISGQKSSLVLKGKKKPLHHGQNVSKATKGIPKPWAQGDRNVSKRPEVRKKISESWKNRIIGQWYTDEQINLYVKPGEIIPEGFRRGRKKLKK